METRTVVESVESVRDNGAQARAQADGVQRVRASGLGLHCWADRSDIREPTTPESGGISARNDAVAVNSRQTFDSATSHKNDMPRIRRSRHEHWCEFLCAAAERDVESSSISSSLH